MTANRRMHKKQIPTRWQNIILKQDIFLNLTN
ncbi:hypothetical protein M0804_015535 [Polistes exclamans]|nr:hypothetical protein M0804_015535 [Polistes exclamans]